MNEYPYTPSEVPAVCDEQIELEQTIEKIVQEVEVCQNFAVYLGDLLDWGCS